MADSVKQGQEKVDKCEARFRLACQVVKAVRELCNMPARSSKGDRSWKLT